MPIAANLHRPVSRRGQWRDSYIIVIDNPPFDAGSAVFRMDVRSQDGRRSVRDYGFDGCDGPIPALSARTDGATARLTVAAVPTGLAVAWLFSSTEMRRLCAGSYEASISVAIGDEDAELALINFVVR